VVLLISTYDMGRQPFGLASAAAALRAAGTTVVCADLARQRLEEGVVRQADVVAFFLPMHTATRLAIPVIDRVRSINPHARLIAYGLYAPLTGTLLREHGVESIIGGEFEDELTRSARLQSRVTDSEAELKLRATGRAAHVPRVTFRPPDRSGLLPLTKYATLQVGTERRTVGYTEASRGCKHRCRHCPIVPVYDGRFRIVPVDIVMADVRAQVAAGARHITFGDPDFFNGIGHATAVVTAFAREFPGVSYDVTIKIEHLLRHDAALALLSETGCAFVTSAVEAVDDEVLRALEKGHTRADFELVVERFRNAGLALSPTFVAFTPWTTLTGYVELLQTIEGLGLIEHVAPIQLAIRLLVTEGSRLLELEDVRQVIRGFNPRSLTYPWAHRDHRVDVLQQQIERLVGVNMAAPRRELFERIWHLSHEAAGLPAAYLTPPLPSRAAVPYLNEPWYC
jgi:radical SAM superfamily enzyme YgiQ (UPF0313 family)